MTNLEIERRWCLKGNWPYASKLQHSFMQSYVREYRYRIIDGLTAEKTVKTGTGMVRTELNQPIPVQIALNTVAASHGFWLHKQRFVSVYKGYTVTLDYFGDHFAYVEIEFPTIEEAEAFIAPSFFGEEITNTKGTRDIFMEQKELAGF